MSVAVKKFGILLFFVLSFGLSNVFSDELPSRAEMWEMIQQQQAQIEYLRQKLDERIELPVIQNRIADLETRIEAQSPVGYRGSWVDQVEISGVANLTIQGSSGVGADSGGDATDASFSAQMTVSIPVSERGTAGFIIEGAEGAGLEGEEVETFQNVNGDAVGTTDLYFMEAWYEHQLNDDLVFTIGKVDLTNYFDTSEVANDWDNQFVSQGFHHSMGIEFGGGLGARITYSPSEWIDLSFGVQEPDDGDFEDVFDKPFVIGEVGLKPKIKDLQGNYRVSAWTNRADHTANWDLTSANKAGSGVNLNFDQQLNEQISVFGRYGNRSNEYEFDRDWSFGLATTMAAIGRSEDVVGFAIGEAMSSDWYALGKINPKDERHWELYYRYAVNDLLSITADGQWIENALGEGDTDTIFVGSVRTTINF